MSKLSKQKSRLPRPDSDDDCERISAILAPNEPFDEDPPEASPETLQRYQDFLNAQLPLGIKMTGCETVGYFAWEESFQFGSGSSKEYRTMKEKYASSLDIFELMSLSSWDAELGLMATVKRIADQKHFTIPLADLEVCPTKEHQLVDDYSSWFVNYGSES